MVKIGEDFIKRPKYIVFLDKDGTTDLEDKKLNNIFDLVTAMGGMIIFVTGRTVGDIENELKEKKIKLPKIIVGDNGAVICYTKTNEFLEQKELEQEKITKIVDDFIKNGGNPDYIRFTNGMEVFASNHKEVAKYYRKNKSVKLCDDIYEKIKNEKHITKLVLSGPREQIKRASQFIEGLDYWTDRDTTKFPRKEYQNDRLDIAQKNINKGDSVRRLVDILQPEYGYMCVGNGFNDVSMFQVAIDDGMRVAIMSNSPDGLLEQIQQYSQEKKKGKVEKVPYDKNLANNYILKKAKCFETYIKTQEKKGKQSRRFPDLQRISTPRVDLEEFHSRNISRGTTWQIKNRDR